jgi:hypothetical protein
MNLFVIFKVEVSKLGCVEMSEKGRGKLTQKQLEALARGRKNWNNKQKRDKKKKQNSLKKRNTKNVQGYIQKKD